MVEQYDGAQAMEGAMVTKQLHPTNEGVRESDHGRWRADVRVDKYWGDDREAHPNPYDTVTVEDCNILVTNGIGILLNALIVAASPLWNATNARIGVGDSATAATIADTDLNAASNKLRVVVNSIPTVAANVLTAVATFTTGQANYAWQEWGLFNAASGATSMLNHAVVSLGTKTSASAWTITVTITIT
jgi:hypothetical protein